MPAARAKEEMVNIVRWLEGTRGRLLVVASLLLATAGVTSLAAALLVSSTGGVSPAAAHGGDPTKIHACINNNPLGFQILRIIQPTAVCGGDETPLDWSIQGTAGPPGPSGAPGPQGSPGPAGPRGPAGPANTTVRSATFTVPPCGQGCGVTEATGTASCNSGEVATGGGFLNVQSLIIGSSRPNPVSGTPTAWVVRALNELPVSETPTVYVICAAS